MWNTPGDEAIALRLRPATMQLSRRMRQESGSDAAITPSKSSALSSVDANGPMRMIDLARSERVSKSSITRIVGSLAEMGLVELLDDPADGRSTLVGVTPKGKQVLAQTSEHADAFLIQRLSTFTDAEKTILQAAVLLLERLGAPRGVRNRRTSD